jgi:hypothetical protein
MNISCNPPMSILIVSHNKPTLLPEAVESVLNQTLTNWQAILIDSGVLHDRGYFAQFAWANDSRLRIVRSTETPELRRRKAMAPWCFNECFRRGWVQGELVMYLCDDDLLYPNAFAAFVDAFHRESDTLAMYASQDIAWVSAEGQSTIVGERRALAPGGQCCAGRIMDCQVDYLQLCHRRSVLDRFSDTEYWPEDRATGDHADGLFMEKLGRICEIAALDVKVSQNRRTPWSVNLPASASAKPADKASAVHESIMDAWTAVRCQMAMSEADACLQQTLANFQLQLRLMCEQDQAQRLRLVSKRYRIADALHAAFTKVPGAIRLWKSLIASY